MVLGFIIVIVVGCFLFLREAGSGEKKKSKPLYAIEYLYSLVGFE